MLIFKRKQKLSFEEEVAERRRGKTSRYTNLLGHSAVVG